MSQGELVKAGSPQFRSNFRTLQSTTLASSTLQFFRHHRNTPGDGLEPISTSSSTRNQAPQQFGTAQAHESVANALVPSLAGDLRSFGKFTGNPWVFTSKYQGRRCSLQILLRMIPELSMLVSLDWNIIIY